MSKDTSVVDESTQDLIGKLGTVDESVEEEDDDIPATQPLHSTRQKAIPKMSSSMASCPLAISDPSTVRKRAKSAKDCLTDEGTADDEFDQATFHKTPASHSQVPANIAMEDLDELTEKNSEGCVCGHDLNLVQLACTQCGGMSHKACYGLEQGRKDLTCLRCVKMISEVDLMDLATRRRAVLCTIRLM